MKSTRRYLLFAVSLAVLLFTSNGFLYAQQKVSTKTGRTERAVNSIDSDSIAMNLQVKTLKIKGHIPQNPRFVRGAWSLTGKVVDTMGNPLSGVAIRRVVHPKYSPKNAWYHPEDYFTNEDGLYTIETKLGGFDNRCFIKEGYRVAGEKKAGTRVYLIYGYNVLNPIIMVPEDYTGDESKYEVGCIKFMRDDYTFYCFEQLKFTKYLQKLNIIDITGSSIDIKQNIQKGKADWSLDSHTKKADRERKKELRKKERLK